jgi:hypothetical protein
MSFKRATVFLGVIGAAALLLSGVSGAAFAGSIFLTGHDPDFHATSGNTTGARNINNAAINFIRDPLFNPFVASAPKFLFVESKGTIPGGHLQGKNGIVASGHAEGVAFDHHDFTTLNAALDLLGTPGGYSAIVVASDFGGILRQAELNILNARAADIIAFLNAGGGIYAMAESNLGAGLTPGGGHFGFLPFVVSSVSLNQTEVGFTVTAFGASLGLTNSDVNGNFSHNLFNGTFGLNVVDLDSQQSIISLAGRIQIPPLPEPGALPLLALALLSAFGMALSRSRRRRSA